MSTNTMSAESATRVNHERPVRGVLYARAAVDPGGRSIARQLETCRRFAREQGLTVTREYSDVGRPVMQNYRPPGFQRMLEVLVEKRLQAVIVHDLLRFSRNSVDCLRTRDELRQSEVRVFTVQEPDDSEDHRELAAALRTAFDQITAAGGNEGTVRR